MADAIPEPSTRRRSGEPGCSRGSCPTTSSRLAGRIRTASGAAADPPYAPSPSPVASGTSNRPSDTMSGIPRRGDQLGPGVQHELLRYKGLLQFQHPVVAAVDDVQVALAVQRNTAWIVQTGKRQDGLGGHLRVGVCLQFQYSVVTTVGDVDGAGDVWVYRHTVRVVEARERQHGRLLRAIALCRHMHHPVVASVGDVDVQPSPVDYRYTIRVVEAGEGNDGGGVRPSHPCQDPIG